MQRTYPAIVSCEDGVYGMTFPDFPGCVSSGRSPEEAISCGHHALTAHIALMAEDGDTLPEPTPLAQVDTRLLDADGTVIGVGEDVFGLALLTVAVPGRIVRYNVSLDESLVAEIDRVAGKGNRSAFLAAAAAARLAALRTG